MTDASPKPPAEASRLAALVDGAVLDPEAARALWTEFSAHMDEHRGDMAGFAKKKGWQSVAPEFRQGKAVLVVRTGAPMAATARPVQAARPAQKAAKPVQKGAQPVQKAKGPARPQGSKGAGPQGKKGPPGKKR